MPRLRWAIEAKFTQDRINENFHMQPRHQVGFAIVVRAILGPAILQVLHSR